MDKVERLTKENEFSILHSPTKSMKDLKKSNKIAKKLSDAKLQTELEKLRKSGRLQAKYPSIPVLTKEDEKLLEIHSGLKLQIELVPASCFMSNVRSHTTSQQWDAIRFKVYEKAIHKCEICGGVGTKHPVECHEVWIYDDIKLIQHLGRFQSLCPLCHEVKHIGLARMLGNAERARERFRNINDLNSDLADKIRTAVFKQHSIRSRNNWTLNIDEVSKYGINPLELKEINKPKNLPFK